MPWPCLIGNCNAADLVIAGSARIDVCSTYSLCPTSTTTIHRTTLGSPPSTTSAGSKIIISSTSKSLPITPGPSTSNTRTQAPSWLRATLRAPHSTATLPVKHLRHRNRAGPEQNHRLELALGSLLACSSSASTTSPSGGTNGLPRRRGKMMGRQQQARLK